jgi:large subunit ribosomal protein L4
MQAPLYDVKGKRAGDITLDKDIFEGDINRWILREVILAHHANQRRGTASTKTRGEVRGGGRKPFAQKGTGRARAGTIRSPLRVGGGITFGPKPRSFEYSLPKKIKRSAFKSSLRKKLRENSVFVLDKVKLNEPKTREMAKLLSQFPVEGKTLLILEKWNEKIKRASSNLKYLQVRTAPLVSAYDILSHESILVTRGALSKIEERLKK